ncbi:hypothetical protein C8J56DRAFT_886800 [Mycena floridula]|nr:hypothetical protein C8J56DRAFT_886800 [Mycena floridula]
MDARSSFPIVVVDCLNIARALGSDSYSNEDDPFSDNPVLIELIDKLIDRADTHPLSVSIAVYMRMSRKFVGLALILLYTETLAIPSFRNLSLSFPELKHLWLVISRAESSPFSFSDTPKLKTIDICGVMPPFVFELPLSRIEEFVSVFPSLSPTLPVLDGLTSMKECTIACIYEPNEIPIAIRTLRSVTSLSLYAQIHAGLIQPSPETDPIAQFLHYLTLPALSFLELIGSINVDVLVSFQDRSSCPLKNLAITGTFLSADECFRLLAPLDHMPDLKVEKLLEKIESDPFFLPELKFLKLKG